MSVKSYDEMTPEQKFAYKAGALQAERSERAFLKDVRDEWEPIYRMIQKRDDDNTALTQMADDFDRLLNG